MSEVWKSTLPMTEKMVLLCLADFANDRGECWPAVDTIAAKCSCSDRTVQKAIKSLMASGVVTVKDEPGRSHNFTIHPRRIFTPEESSPPKISAKPPKNLHPRGEYPSPKPSYNHQEPSTKRAFPDWLPLNEWAAFEDMRNKIRKPMTDRARELAFKRLNELRAGGNDPADVLNQSVLNSYQGLFPVKGRKEERDEYPVA